MRTLIGIVLLCMFTVLSGCTGPSLIRVKPSVKNNAQIVSPGDVFLEYSTMGFFQGERTIYTLRSVEENGFTLESNTYKKGVSFSTKLAIGKWQRDTGFQRKHFYPVASGKVSIDGTQFTILSIEGGAVRYRRVK